MKRVAIFLTFSFYALNVFSQKQIKKIALVVGVANYQYAGQLKNTLNDANDIADVMSEMGFEVIKVLDPDLRAFNFAIDSFRRKLDGASVSLFFYSGHGAEYNGENYLFPINSNPTVPNDLIYDAIPVGKILDKSEYAKVKTTILLLDACRSNPFTRNWNKGANQYEGLTNINAPDGTFIGFAASPGKTASDGTRRNGLYTEAILSFIKSKNASIDQIFNKVNKEVRTQSGGKQIPFKNSSLDDEYYFIKTETNGDYIWKTNYPLAVINRPKFPMPKTVKGYTQSTINSYSTISINKKEFAADDFIELCLTPTGPPIWDKSTPIYVTLTKRSNATGGVQIWNEEFKQSDDKTIIRFSSDFPSGIYELSVGFYLISELTNEFPALYSKRFTIKII